MKKILTVLFVALVLSSMSVLSISCAKKVVKKEVVIIVVKGTVVNSQAVKVGEFPEGAKVVTGGVPAGVATWDGFKLGIKAEGKFYQYLSTDMYYEGDGVMITVKDGVVTKVKNKP